MYCNVNMAYAILCNTVQDFTVNLEIFRNQITICSTVELAYCITQALSSLETNELSFKGLMRCYPAAALDITVHWLYATLFLVNKFKS